jgi:hypothetical protein
MKLSKWLIKLDYGRFQLHFSIFKCKISPFYWNISSKFCNVQKELLLCINDYAIDTRFSWITCHPMGQNAMYIVVVKIFILVVSLKKNIQNI